MLLQSGLAKLPREPCSTKLGHLSKLRGFHLFSRHFHPGETATDEIKHSKLHKPNPIIYISKLLTVEVPIGASVLLPVASLRIYKLTLHSEDSPVEFLISP